MKPPRYDVCVVGSGPGGGTAAYVLATAGLKVALVESGPPLRPTDYNAHAKIYPNLDARLRAGLGNPVPSVTDFSDRNHFTPVGDRPAHGLLRAVGGRSLCWAGHSLRFGPADFKQWPIAYDDVAPYYDRAERLMVVYGDRDGLWNMPDGIYCKSVPLRCGEELLKRGVEKMKSSGRTMEFIRIRKAIPTEAGISKRPVCHYCGNCMRGCEVDSKFTTANTSIPLAMKTGNLTLLSDTTMTRLVLNQGTNRISGIDWIDRSGKSGHVECRVLILSCSAVETARQLLIHQMANSSGQVGRNLSSHFGLTVVGTFPELLGRNASNDDGTDYFHGLLTSLYWKSPHPAFEGTYQVQCGSGLHPFGLAIRTVPGYGTKLKREIRDLNSIHAGMGMQGALAISSRKYVDLDPVKTDRLGKPIPRIHLHYEDNDVAMAKDMADTCSEIIETAGGKVHSRPSQIQPKTLAIDANHWVGTARMGKDSKTSVVNEFGQSHDIPNLFLGDASVFAANPEKNPTLTNTALSWRMSDHLLESMRKGELG